MLVSFVLIDEVMSDVHMLVGTWPDQGRLLACASVGGLGHNPRI